MAKLSSQELNNYHFFFSGNSPFSNFHPSKINGFVLLEDKTYYSVEHGFVFLKLCILQDKNAMIKLAKVISELAIDISKYSDNNDPVNLYSSKPKLWHDYQNEIKRVGRSADPTHIKAWGNIKEQVMENLVYLKFLQNPNLCEELLKTENKILVEASPWDRIWGIGYDRKEAVLIGTEHWGENKLGKILVNCREKIKAELDKVKKVVE